MAANFSVKKLVTHTVHDLHFCSHWKKTTSASAPFALRNGRRVRCNFRKGEKGLGRKRGERKLRGWWGMK